MFSMHRLKMKWLKEIKHSSTSNGRFRNILNKSLLLTNVLTCGGCMALGDLVEQELEFRNKIIPVRYDWIRTRHMFTVGTVLGPLYHFYYTTLDRCIPEVNLKTTVIKVLCDQILLSPVNLLCFYCGMDYLEGKSFEGCKEELKKKFWRTFSIDCCYWPPVQFINFYFLPTTYRVLYINVATLIYYIFLSYMKHSDQNK